MNPSIWFGTMSLGWFILHFKGYQVNWTSKLTFCLLGVSFVADSL